VLPSELAGKATNRRILCLIQPAVFEGGHEPLNIVAERLYGAWQLGRANRIHGLLKLINLTMAKTTDIST
jgi:hypothetical protein